MTLNRTLLCLRLAALLASAQLFVAGCGGGGGATADVVPLEAVQPVLVLQQVRQFGFSWSDAAAATHYRLLENPDGLSGYSQVGADILPGEEGVVIEVPLYHRVSASYIVQSCDATQCLDSDQMQVSGSLVDSVGYFKASNAEAGDQFGFALALSADGNVMAIGAPSEDSAAQGVDGDSADNSLASSGAVFIFSNTAAGWQQSAYLKAHNPDAGDQFGYAIDLSADGNTVAIGARFESSSTDGVDGDGVNNFAYQAGAGYVFFNDGSNWQQQAYIKAPNSDASDRFGWSLSLSASGDKLAVSAIGEASASAGVGGDTSDNSAAMAGAIYLFERSAGSWQYAEYFKAHNTDAGDTAGFGVSLSGDGKTLVFGAHGEASAGTGTTANPVDNSASFAGAAYVFTESAGVWTQQAYLKSSNTNGNDRFGWSVSLDHSGDVLAVGTYAEESAAQGIGADQLDNSAEDVGAVYLFERDAGVWAQQAYIKAANAEAWDLFGFIVRLSGDGNALMAGAYGESGMGAGILEASGSEAGDNSMPDAGAAYLFTRSGGGWQPLRYLKATHPDVDDLFAWALDISSDGNTVAVAAQLEASAATGISGDATDNSADNAGAVYLF
ncbi:MAG: FG-GAP repeat protein [Gammaproteobacteria bacterium]|nr:FG-GAP repeat protein [Gammaproteobacteria bacterium]NND38122.1 integrin [Pseudomonadales bacterium]